ncbi:MAG: class I SAM-dependent methyltransferase [Coriobacteriaceae bacterium]|nr:class I SAM-dependent methyltransferase [Coriobacteriaceae bacterium]
MVDFGELWRQEAKARRAPDGPDAWDERARDAVTKYGPSEYSEEFLRLARLLPGETVLDMGCGAGALAVPCAQRGHDVLAADFSPVMLARCAATVPADAPGTVSTKLLAWDDDWEAAGIAPKSFDVALASRSIATDDMEAAIAKLSRTARRKVCVTVVSGLSPRVSQPFFADLGLTCRGHQDAAFAFSIACQLGFEPEASFIRSSRIDRFATRDDALADYTKMLRFADEFGESSVPADAEAQAAAWIDEHLLPDAAGGLYVDAPRTFRWAFIAWEV